jgi:hypothetical protein
VRHGSPLYGDRVVVPIIPEVFSLFAGRSGGLGMRLNLFAIPGVPPKMRLIAKWGFTLYLTNPELAKLSNPLLDKVDAVTNWALKVASPVLDPVKAQLQRLRPNSPHPIDGD